MVRLSSAWDTPRLYGCLPPQGHAQLRAGAAPGGETCHEDCEAYTEVARSSAESSLHFFFAKYHQGRNKAKQNENKRAVDYIPI